MGRNMEIRIFADEKNVLAILGSLWGNEITQCSRPEPGKLLPLDLFPRYFVLSPEPSIKLHPGLMAKLAVEAPIDV